jgi:thiamine-phosphate diphosphorylase
MKPFKLYVIIDIDSQGKYPPDKLAGEALSGGADLLQLRYKGTDLRQLWQWGKKIRQLSRKMEVPLIINDRADIALALEAEGVHLGQQDLPLEAARRVLGRGGIIGVSCHSLEQALSAQDMGADYVSLGPIFPTVSKKDARTPVGFSLIEQFNRHLSIPWVAIGGIGLDNLSSLLEAGVERIAVISAVSRAEDAARAARALKKKLLEPTPMDSLSGQ